MRHVANSNGTHFFEVGSDDFIVSVDRKEGKHVYKIPEDAFTHDFVVGADGDVNFYIITGTADVLCSITPNEPGIDVLHVFPYDLL